MSSCAMATSRRVEVLRKKGESGNHGALHQLDRIGGLDATVRLVEGDAGEGM